LAGAPLAGGTAVPGAAPLDGIAAGVALDPVAAAALADFCLAMLNRNEFLYVN